MTIKMKMMMIMMMMVMMMVIMMVMMVMMVVMVMMMVMMVIVGDFLDANLSISTAAAGEVSLAEGEGVLHCVVPEVNFFRYWCYLLCHTACVYIQVLLVQPKELTASSVH